MLLSICMPTYNRPERVRRALSRYGQVIAENGLAGKVEICISDNTPTGETRGVVESFARTSKIRLRYRQNRKNLGYDSNSSLALRMARGKYIHLVSDEDMYSGKMLSSFVRMLESESPDCIILSGHLPTRLKISGDIERWRAMPSRGMLRRMLSLPGKGSIFFGLISCMIIRRDAFRRYDRKVRGAPGVFLGTGYAHIPLYLFALSQARDAIVVRCLFRDREDAANPAAPLLISYPHDLFRLMHAKYFGTMQKARAEGIMSAGEYKLFLDRFFWFSILNIAEVRTYMCPEIFRADRQDAVRFASILADDYSLSGPRRALFSAYVWLLYLPLPYHWVYSAWAWYRIRVKKHRDVIDIHRAYRDMLAAKGQKFDMFIDRDPTL